MIVTIFDSRDDPAADQGFGRWYEEPGEKYFLNRHSLGRATLHRAPCPHYVFGRSVRLARTQKVCAESDRDLRRWAIAAGVTVEPCSDCERSSRLAPAHQLEFGVKG